MKLIPIDYQGGQIWVDKEAEVKPNQLVWFAGRPRTTDNIDERFLIWNFVFADSDISAIDYQNYDKPFAIVAQSNNLCLPNIPYVEIVEDIAAKALDAGKEEINGAGEISDNEKLFGLPWYISGYIVAYKAASAKKYTEKDCINAVKHVLSEWKTSCINMKGEPNIEFLADIELTLQSIQSRVTSIEIQMTVYKHPKNLVAPIFGPLIYKKDSKIFLKVKSVQYEKD